MRVAGPRMRASSTVFGEGARMLRKVMLSESRDRMLVVRVDAVFMSVDSFLGRDAVCGSR